MQYDIIFVIGETLFDHPLSGPGLLKRLLEKYGYSVGVIEMPKKHEDVTELGAPRLFFAISSGSIDSMIRNYNAIKRPRDEDPNLNNDDISDEPVADRAVIVFCNWIRRHFKESIIVIGGVEATLRRFTHYDYWDNALRKPILVDSRADILCYGNSEKQILQIAGRLKDSYAASDDVSDARLVLNGIRGTCVVLKRAPTDVGFTLLPSHEEALASKERFCDMQDLFCNESDLAEQVGDRYVVQYRSPRYESSDLDEYYGLPFTRYIPPELRYLRGFQFSVVTHRGCIGRCNFCSLTLTQGDKIISRSEESILKEIEGITTLEYFKGNIDDLGGPAANMYGMDCIRCEKECITCPKLRRDNKRLIALLKRARAIPGIKRINIRSGIRYDLCSEEYLKEIVTHHVAKTLRIAPEHVCEDVLELMNKNHGDLGKFIALFDALVASNPGAKGKELSFYFMTAHPGSTMEHAKELSKFIKRIRNAEAVQIFTPTPMSVSTCMYHTGLDPKTRKQVYVPYAYSEKKEQKRVLMR